MQLVAYGAQDVYLTGNPQITFFKVVYRRHTNFSMESIKQSSTGGDDQKTWTISRNGDLILNMYLENCLFHINKTDFGEYNNYMQNGNLAANSINYYEYKRMMNSFLDTIRYTIEIGGQTIDRFDNLFRRTYNCLTDKNPTGDENTLLLRMEDSGIWNLPFWFCRNPGLALPLIALQYHEVKLIVDMNKARDLRDGSTAMELWVDYAYLDTDERRRFAQVSHEYLIEQVQSNSYQINNSSQTLDINFNHPVKELIWNFKDNNNVGTIHAIPNNTISNSANVVLSLNGQERFSKRKPEYFSELQVWKYHSGFGSLVTSDSDADFIYDFDTDNIPINTGGTGASKTRLIVPIEPVYVYSFALKPEEHQPSGTCNFSRIDNASLHLSGIFNNMSIISESDFPDSGKGAGTFDRIKATEYRHPVSICNLYAINYNVLRIMSGMGGLAYSN